MPSVVQIRDARRLYRPLLAELEVRHPRVIEEADPRSEENRDQMQGQLVQQPGDEELLRQSGTPRNGNVAAIGCLLGECHGCFDAIQSRR